MGETRIPISQVLNFIDLVFNFSVSCAGLLTGSYFLVLSIPSSLFSCIVLMAESLLISLCQMSLLFLANQAFSVKTASSLPWQGSTQWNALMRSLLSVPEGQKLDHSLSCAHSDGQTGGGICHLYSFTFQSTILRKKKLINLYSQMNGLFEVTPPVSLAHCFHLSLCQSDWYAFKCSWSFGSGYFSWVLESWVEDID